MALRSAEELRAIGAVQTRRICVVERYLERSGRRPQALGVHVALASFKLAAIFEGIHLRVAQGAAEDAGFGDVGDAVEPLLAAGLRALKA